MNMRKEDGIAKAMTNQACDKIIVKAENGLKAPEVGSFWHIRGEVDLTFQVINCVTINDTYELTVIKDKFYI